MLLFFFKSQKYETNKYICLLSSLREISIFCSNFFLPIIFFLYEFCFLRLKNIKNVCILYIIVAPSSYASNSSQTPPPTGSTAHSLIRDYWYELKFSDLFKFINPDGRYQCPRFNCLKSYKDASSLQRHIRWVYNELYMKYIHIDKYVCRVVSVCSIPFKLKYIYVYKIFLYRYECGGQKKFRCLMCGKAFSQSSHLKRHLESGVCVKYYLWDNVFFKIK